MPLLLLGEGAMARFARCEVFDPNEVAMGHIFARVCRRCWLFGDDPVSGKNFDHRKGWIEAYLPFDSF